GNDDRVAVRIEPGDDADMAAVLTAREHRNGADLRPGNAMAVLRERPGGIRTGAGVADLGQNEIHEARAPEAIAAGRVGAEIFARLDNELGPTGHRLARVRRHLNGLRDQTVFVAIDRNARLLSSARMLHLRMLLFLRRLRRRSSESRNAERDQADAANGEH